MGVIGVTGITFTGVIGVTGMTTGVRIDSTIVGFIMGISCRTVGCVKGRTIGDATGVATGITMGVTIV